MKVLWLCSWYPNSADLFDGDFVERHARSLATQQQLDVIHIVQNANLLKRIARKIEERSEKDLNVKICFVPTGNTGSEKINALLFNVRYYKTLRFLLTNYIAQNGKPDIVHVHVPVKMGAGAIWLKRKFNIPFVVTEHATAYFRASHDNYFDRRFPYRYVTKRTFTAADAVTSVSDCLMKVLDDLFAVKHQYLIRNSVDTELFFPVNTNNEVKQFIHVSMMVPFKNVEGILRALALLKKRTESWQMIFVGPATSAQIALANELKLADKIVWKGALPYADVAREMQCANALIHFSNYENLPCVVTEALCCGVPVISSNVGGIAELVNAQNGILVEARQVEQLSDAMENFLQHPEQFDKTKISDWALARFNYKTIGAQLAGVYRDVLARRKIRL